ncbi:hypothetical protein HI914_02031 [Erysiphe necator]|nr:hypothetical protein HI914_02031 [Erysiphe necator]
MLTSIFGGELPWSSRDWTSSNDTVRGGKSSSSFKFIESNSVAIFSGYLDVSTLGGAGFASQRTKGNDRVWDLSNYDGIVLNIKKADGKKYTFSLKDQVVAPTQSSISWDYNFITTGDEQVKIFWSDLEPTYRGRVLEDTTPLNLKEIRGFSLMMRRS